VWRAEGFGPLLLLLLQLKDVTEQIGHLTEAITAASAAVGE
jgi:hypothetical protein